MLCKLCVPHELKALFICRVVQLKHGGLYGPGDRLRSEDLSVRKFYLQRCIKDYVTFFRYVSEKGNGILQGGGGVGRA